MNAKPNSISSHPGLTSPSPISVHRASLPVRRAHIWKDVPLQTYSRQATGIKIPTRKRPLTYGRRARDSDNTLYSRATSGKWKRATVVLRKGGSGQSCSRQKAHMHALPQTGHYRLLSRAPGRKTQKKSWFPKAFRSYHSILPWGLWTRFYHTGHTRRSKDHVLSKEWMNQGKSREGFQTHYCTLSGVRQEIQRYGVT